MSAPTPAPSSPAPLPHFDLRNTFGAIFLGGTASVGILGITVLQAWLYYSNYPDDRRFVKLLVAVVCIIEFIRSSFTVAATYHYLVTEWGNPLALNQNIWTLDIVVFMTNLGELFGHLYFAWRVWILSRGRLRLVLTSLIVFLTLSNLAMGLATWVFSIKASTLTQISEGPITVLSPVALGTAIATDIVIMLSLIFLLHRGRTGFSKTNRLINTLIFYAIQVGSITAITDVVILILNQISSTGLSYLAVYAVVGNLYANALLASLNARSSLRSREAVSTELSTMHTASMQGGFRSRNTDSSGATSKETGRSRTYHLSTSLRRGTPAGTQASTVLEQDEEAKRPVYVQMDPSLDEPVYATRGPKTPDEDSSPV